MVFPFISHDPDATRQAACDRRVIHLQQPHLLGVRDVRQRGDGLSKPGGSLNTQGGPAVCEARARGLLLSSVKSLSLL